jgi:hypothetical protein
MEYKFYDIEITIDEELYMCTGTISFEYEPGEPDEPWGYHGATPGYASSANDIDVLNLASAVWCDEFGQPYDKSLIMRSEICDAIVDYFENNNSILTDEVEA